MRTAPSRGLVTLVSGLVLVLGLLAGCSDDDDASLLADGTAPSLADAQQVLDDRAAAVRDGDLEAFLASLDASDRKLVSRQRRYFTNLQQLPLEEFDYDVLKSEWPDGLKSASWGTRVLLPQVRLATQLAGFSPSGHSDFKTS